MFLQLLKNKSVKSLTVTICTTVYTLLLTVLSVFFSQVFRTELYINFTTSEHIPVNNFFLFAKLNLVHCLQVTLMSKNNKHGLESK